MSEKICVIGGNGNIGRPVTELLVQGGHEVTVLSRSGKPAVEGAKMIQIDRLQREAFEEFFQQYGFDGIIDFTCFTPEDASSTIQAGRDNTRHILQISTVCTYGVHPDQYPVHETDALKPHIPYGQNKANADALFLHAHREHGLPVTILKPSTTYGPKQGLLRQIGWDHSWLERIRTGKPILQADSGLQMHQFMHVDDAARAITGLLFKKDAVGQTYNIVPDHAITWQQYHQTAMRVLNRDVELVNAPGSLLIRHLSEEMYGIYRDIFTHHSFYSAERLRHALPCFSPKISLEKGMAQVIDALNRDRRIPTANTRLNFDEDMIIEEVRR